MNHTLSEHEPILPDEATNLISAVPLINMSDTDPEFSRRTSSDIAGTLARFVESYLNFGKAAARQTIEKFSTMVQAQKDLGPPFDQFCKLVRLDPKSATFRKKRMIGENAERLLKIADKLPPSWTTIYKIAEIKPTVLDQLLNSGFLHPELSAKELTFAIRQYPASGGLMESGQAPINRLERSSIRIKTGSLPSGELLRFYRELHKLLASFDMNIPETVADALASYAERKAA